MIANKKRIRSLNSNMGFIQAGKDIVVGVKIEENDKINEL